MKKGFNILLMVCAVLMVMSCNKTKTYTDMLNDQRKAIDKLMADSDFVVLKNYPANGVFGENEFVKLDNGVYLNVIDSGNGNRAVLGKTKIYSRFITYSLLGTADTLRTYGSHSNGTNPIEFMYGNYTTLISSATSASSDDYYTAYVFGEGMQTPLEYVGDQAKVKLIVPFQVGASTSSSNGIPWFFEILQYKFNE